MIIVISFILDSFDRIMIIIIKRIIMPFLLPLATALTAILTVKTVNKTIKTMERRKKRKQRYEI